MKTEQIDRETIIKYMDYSPELETLFSDIIALKNQGANFRNCLTFAGITEDESRKIDSAYPSDYATQIRDIYPVYNKGMNCFSYIHNPYFGVMLNVKNLIADRILKPF